MTNHGQPLLDNSNAGEALDDTLLARRKLLTMGGVLVDFSTNAMAGGFSPLVIPIGRAFRGTYLFGTDAFAEGMFLYVYFVRFSISVLWGFVFLDAAISRHPEHGGIHMLTLALWPAGLALLGWAVSQKSVALVMLAAVVLGVGHGPSKYNGAVLLPSWWAVDDKVNRCQATLGFFRGLGAIFWILFFGGVTGFVGEDRVDVTLYFAAGLQFCLLAIAVVPVMSKAEFHQVPRAKRGSPSKNGAQDTVGGAGHASGEPPSSLLTDWQFYAVVAITTSISFTGLGVKQLLAVLYQEGVHLAYDTSARYAATSLLLYWVLMTLSPLMATRAFLLPMYAGALAVEGLLYGMSSVAVDMQDASVLLSCRVLSGGLLAVMLINKTSLNVEVLGKDRLKRMKRLGAPLDILGGAGGLSAWILHVRAEKASGGWSTIRPVDEQASFNSFFLLSSAMMFGASLLTLCLWGSGRGSR